MATVVIFREDKETNEIVAFFPEIPGAVSWNSMLFYEHIGQHGAAEKKYYLEGTKPTENYHALLQELISVGYDDLVIRHKITRKHDEIRMEQIK